MHRGSLHGNSFSCEGAREDRPTRPWCFCFSTSTVTRLVGHRGAEHSARGVISVIRSALYSVASLLLFRLSLLRGVTCRYGEEWDVTGSDSLGWKDTKKTCSRERRLNRISMAYGIRVLCHTF